MSREEDEARQVISVLIAHLPDTPYPDDPRWSPWTRWGETAVARVEHLLSRLEQAEKVIAAAWREALTHAEEGNGFDYCVCGRKSADCPGYALRTALHEYEEGEGERVSRSSVGNLGSSGNIKVIPSGEPLPIYKTTRKSGRSWYTCAWPGCPQGTLNVDRIKAHVKITHVECTCGRWFAGSLGKHKGQVIRQGIPHPPFEESNGQSE